MGRINTFIGIDNGVTGSVGIIQIDPNEIVYVKTPIKKELNYTKSKQWLNRVDGVRLRELLSPYDNMSTFVFLERPMINHRRFKPTISACRALEATLIVLELLKLPYLYIDSKEWQKVLLPKGLKKEELKEASLQVARRLFPHINYKGFKDADGLLIAEWARRRE